MKVIIIILLISIPTVNAHAQEAINGTLFDMKSGKPLNLVSRSYTCYLIGNGKTISISIDSVGRYMINRGDLIAIGENISLNIGGSEQIIILLNTKWEIFQLIAS